MEQTPSRKGMQSRSWGFVPAPQGAAGPAGPHSPGPFLALPAAAAAGISQRGLGGAASWRLRGVPRYPQQPIPGKGPHVSSYPVRLKTGGEEAVEVGGRHAGPGETLVNYPGEESDWALPSLTSAPGQRRLQQRKEARWVKSVGGN